MLRIHIAGDSFPFVPAEEKELIANLRESGEHPVAEDNPNALRLIFREGQSAALHESSYTDEEHGVLVIDPEVAQYHGFRVQVLDPQTLGLVRMVIHDVTDEWPLPEGKCSRPLAQLVGYVDLTLKLRQMPTGPRTVVWRHPEAGLHPSLQADLADLIVKIHFPHL